MSDYKYEYYDKDTIKSRCNSIGEIFDYASKPQYFHCGQRMLKSDDPNSSTTKPSEYDTIMQVVLYDKEENNYTEESKFLNNIAKTALKLIDKEEAERTESNFKFIEQSNLTKRGESKGSSKLKTYAHLPGIWKEGKLSVAVSASKKDDEIQPFSLCVRTYIDLKGNKDEGIILNQIALAVLRVGVLSKLYGLDEIDTKDYECEPIQDYEMIIDNKLAIHRTTGCDVKSNIVKIKIDVKKDKDNYKEYSEIVSDIFMAFVKIKAINKYIQVCAKSGADASESMKVFRKLDDFFWALRCAKDLELNLSPTMLKLNDLVFDDCKQMVMTGAPGTGKTYSAKEYIRWQLLAQYLRNYDGSKYTKQVEILKEALKNDDKNGVIKSIIDGEDGQVGNWEMVQFHPSFDYTDFVEGLRPVKVKVEEEIKETQGDGAPSTKIKTETSFVRIDGVFKQFCRKAAESKEKRFFFIDEINRADLSKVFGELMFCLEEGYRGDKHVIKTQYSNLDTYQINGKDYAERLKDLGVGNLDNITEFEKREITRYESIETEILNSLNSLKELNNTRSDGASKNVNNCKKEFESSSDDERKNLIDKMKLLLDAETNEIIENAKKQKGNDIAEDLIKTEKEIDKIIKEEKSKLETTHTSNNSAVKDIFEQGFFIPENVIIIGSMNDIDRSVDTFDFALRRRFRWHKVRVDEGLLWTTFTSMNEKNNNRISEDKIENLITSIINMNNVFNDEEYKRIFRPAEDYYVGPAYFGSLFKGDTKNNVWANKVEPILREYVRGRENADEFIRKCKEAYDGKQQEDGKQ